MSHLPGRWLSLSPTARAATPPGAGTMLFSSGRAGLALRRQLPCIPDSRWSAVPDHRRPHDRSARLVRRLARAGARPAPGRPARPSIWTCGPTADTCCSPLDWGRLWTSDRTLMYSFSRCFRRVAGAAGRPGRRPASVSRLTPYQWARVLQAGQPAPGSHFLLRMRARRSAAIPGPRDARRHVRRRLRARCAGAYWRTIAVTMCPGKSGHK